MSEPQKVLLVSFDPLPGESSAGSRLTELIRGLTPVFAVDVLTPKTEGHAHIERYYGARLMRVPMLRRDVPSRAQTFERAVRRQIESDEYDLVHVTDAFGAQPIFQGRSRGGYKIVFDAHALASRQIPIANPEAREELRFSTRLRRIERRALLGADRVLAAPFLLAELRALGVPGDRTREIPPAVDLGLFREVPPPPDGALQIAYLGSCAPWEGTGVLLEALRALLDAGVAARLAVAGTVEAIGRRALRKPIAALHLEEAIEWFGPLPHEEVPGFLARAHACVAPFSAPADAGPCELGSIKLAEYLAAGRPVVAADTPLHRALAGGDAADFFKPGDAADLAARLAALARDPARRADLGERARLHARAAFDADEARRALLRAYYELIDPALVDSPVPEAAAGGGEATTATIAAATAGDREGTHPAVASRDAGDDEPTPQARDGGTAPVAMPSREPPSVPAADDSDWFGAHLPAGSR